MAFDDAVKAAFKSSDEFLEFTESMAKVSKEAGTDTGVLLKQFDEVAKGKQLLDDILARLKKVDPDFKPSAEFANSLRQRIVAQGESAAKAAARAKKISNIAPEYADAIIESAQNVKFFDDIIKAGQAAGKSIDDITAEIAQALRKGDTPETVFKNADGTVFKPSKEMTQEIAEVYMKKSPAGKAALKAGGEVAEEAVGAAVKSVDDIVGEIAAAVGKKLRKEVDKVVKEGLNAKLDPRRIYNNARNKVAQVLDEVGEAAKIKKGIRESLEKAGKDASDEVVEGLYKRAVAKYADDIIKSNKGFMRWAVRQCKKGKAKAVFCAFLGIGTGLVGLGELEGITTPDDPSLANLDPETRKKLEDAHKKCIESGDPNSRACAEYNAMLDAVRSNTEIPPVTPDGGIGGDTDGAPGGRPGRKTPAGQLPKAGDAVPGRRGQAWPEKNEWVGWSSMKVIRRLRELGFVYDSSQTAGGWWKKLPRMHPARVAYRTFWKKGAPGRSRRRRKQKNEPKRVGYDTKQALDIYAGGKSPTGKEYGSHKEYYEGTPTTGKRPPQKYWPKNRPWPPPNQAVAKQAYEQGLDIRGTKEGDQYLKKVE